MLKDLYGVGWLITYSSFLTLEKMTFVPTVKKHVLKDSLHVNPALVAVLACFALLAWASWRKVEFPIIDVGREVEISARILAGQIPYRDVETYYGPLAYYANALALLLFGQRLEVFFGVGLSLALAATLLFYRLILRLTDARWAALGTVCMLIYCALGPGLFNFILPYSYGAVYGIVLCLLAIAALDCYTCTGKTRWLIAAAIACGLAGVAKQEYGVSALGAILVGANLYPQNLQTRVLRSGLILVVTGACVIIPFALVLEQVSWERLHSSLLPISQFGVLNKSTLFQVSPAKTLSIWWATFKSFFASSLVVLMSTIAVHWLLKSRQVNIPQWLRTLFEVLAGFAFAKVGLILLMKLSKLIFHSGVIYIGDPLGNLSWCLPVFIGWFALNRPQLPQYKHAPLMWTLLVFSLLLNSRWLFYINFYGLYAAPVILLFFTLLYHSTQRISGVVWRYLLVCVLIGIHIRLSTLSHYQYAVNSSNGTLYTTNAAQARSLNQTINAIKTSGANSVLVLPEGNILNFLTATHSPSRELTFLPVTLPSSQDEQEFLESMHSHPPELIVYVPRAFREWGYRTYGEFNPLVDQWITKQHKLIQSFPMDEGAIRLYVRN